MSKILVTGGNGYIGSHTVIELVNEDHEVVIVDNLSNSNLKCLRSVENILNRTLTFYNIDIRDKLSLLDVFKVEQPDVVIHFAALKAVGESSQIPLEYYDNNVSGTINLLSVMEEVGCKKFIFSSSATVYGDPEIVPIIEEASLSVTNPYGRTKLMVEDILRDLVASDSLWQVVILRYFNPIGAHPSGEIGEDPNGIPNNLLPYISQVAVNKLSEVSVFGNDYDTLDGTGVRDYIHVVDLAKGHVAALKKLFEHDTLSIYNLGTGKGYSVLETIRQMELVSGRRIPYRIVSRRPGDIASCYANPDRAFKELGWKAKFGIEEMCRDAWNWQSKHPNGFLD